MNKGSKLRMNCSTGSEILRNERSSQRETKLQEAQKQRSLDLIQDSLKALILGIFWKFYLGMEP